MIKCNYKIFHRFFLPAKIFFAIIIGLWLLAPPSFAGNPDEYDMCGHSYKAPTTDHICGSPIGAVSSNGIPAYDNVCPCQINGYVQRTLSTDGINMYSDTDWPPVPNTNHCSSNPTPLPPNTHQTDSVGYQCMEYAHRYFHYIHHRDIGAMLGDDFCPSWWPRSTTPGLPGSPQPTLPMGVHYLPRTDLSADLQSYVNIKPHKGDAIVYNWHAYRNPYALGGGWYGPITPQPGIGAGGDRCFQDDKNSTGPCIGTGHIAIVDSEMDSKGNFTIVQQNPCGSTKTENINNPYICTFIHAGLIGYPTIYTPAEGDTKVIDVACPEEAKVRPLPFGTFDKHPALDPNLCPNTAIWATDADNTYPDPKDGSKPQDYGAIITSPRGGYTDMELARRYACFADVWANTTNHSNNSVCTGVDLTDVDYPEQLAIPNKAHAGTIQYKPPISPNPGDLAIFTPASAQFAMDKYKIDCSRYTNIGVNSPHGHIAVVNNHIFLLTINVNGIDQSLAGNPDRTLVDLADQEDKKVILDMLGKHPYNGLGGSSSIPDACVDTYICNTDAVDGDGKSTCPPK